MRKLKLKEWECEKNGLIYEIKSISDYKFDVEYFKKKIKRYIPLNCNNKIEITNSLNDIQVGLSMMSNNGSIYTSNSKRNKEDLIYILNSIKLNNLAQDILKLGWLYKISEFIFKLIIK